MKHQNLLSVAAVALFAFAMVSFVSAGTIVAAKVPFDFTVGEKSVPAGNYTISESRPGMLGLEGPQSIRCFLLANQGTRRGDDRSPRLVFHRYGDQYFLSEVFDGLSEQAVQIPVSKLEKEYARQASNSTAGNLRQPEVVAIYALAR